MINVVRTNRKLIHKNGEEIAPERKAGRLEKSRIFNALPVSAVFLKQSWEKVSRMSLKIRKRRIVSVTFFLDIDFREWGPSA